MVSHIREGSTKFKLDGILMIIFNNLCPLVRPNFLHPGTTVPREVGLAGRP
eukprot:SAG31_NODE_7157_length_1771_cov_2.869019_1_plen_50_part_10